MEVYSEELIREFRVLEVQEPLISRPPTPYIFNLSSIARPHSPLDLASPHNNSNPDLSQPTSPADLTHQVSRPVSPDLTRFGRRLSRSSLNRSSSQHSSISQISQLLSPIMTSYRDVSLAFRDDVRSTPKSRSYCEYEKSLFPSVTDG